MNKEKRSVLWFIIKRWWQWWFGKGDTASSFGEELNLPVEELRNPALRQAVISKLKDRVARQIAGFSKKMRAEPVLINAFRRRTAKGWTITWTCAFVIHSRKTWREHINRMLERRAAQMVQMKNWEELIWKRSPVDDATEAAVLDLATREAAPAPENGVKVPVTLVSDAPTGGNANASLDEKPKATL